MKKLRLIAMLAVVMVTSVMLVACEKGETNLHKYSDTTINSELERKIRQAYVGYRNDEVLFSDVYIAKYYSTYNNASVVSILVDGEGIGNGIWSETIGGISFFDSSWIPIIVWFENDFHSLQYAYEQGMLTLADLQNVKLIHDKQ